MKAIFLHGTMFSGGFKFPYRQYFYMVITVAYLEIEEGGPGHPERGSARVYGAWGGAPAGSSCGAPGGG